MKVSEIGEFGLIDLLAKIAGTPTDKELIAGIGDDAAVWQSEAPTQLASVDSFIQDVHFSPDIAPWEDVGWKTMAASLSDIAAMGGVPRYALVSLALPGDTEVDDVTALYRGMTRLGQEFETAIVGGNISSAPTVIISVTVLGSSRDKSILTRSTARPGEQIAVSGRLGTGAAGLKMLTGKLQFEPEAAHVLRDAFLHPYPRISEGQLLVSYGVKTAIDISDGLISDLKQICKQSQVSARIEIDRLPVEPTVKANFGEEALELALSGGEDYELLFTASTGVIEKIKRAAPCPVTVIGEIIAGKKKGVMLVDSKGKPFNPGGAGWEHFITR